MGGIGNCDINIDNYPIRFLKMLPFESGITRQNQHNSIPSGIFLRYLEIISLHISGTQFLFSKQYKIDYLVLKNNIKLNNCESN